MYIIFNRQVAEELQNRYFILELPALPAGENQLECFCLVETTKIEAKELTELDQYREQHNQLLANFNSKNLAKAQELAHNLKGRFAGELDSFYDHVIATQY